MCLDVNVTLGLAPGADLNPLACWAHDTIRRRLFPGRTSDHPDPGPALGEGDPRRRSLLAMRATVAVVARDRRISTTLRFDHGTIAIHDGMVGIPDVTFCGAFDSLVSVANMPLSRIGQLPLATPWHELGHALLAGDLKIYGLLGHPRLALRVLRLLAAPS
jgi:hypothetical protein